VFVPLEGFKVFLASVAVCVPTSAVIHLERIPVLQVCPHPPAPSPKKGEGEPD
jgi:hypothetical protein